MAEKKSKKKERELKSCGRDQERNKDTKRCVLKRRMKGAKCYPQGRKELHGTMVEGKESKKLWCKLEDAQKLDRPYDRRGTPKVVMKCGKDEDGFKRGRGYKCHKKGAIYKRFKAEFKSGKKPSKKPKTKTKKPAQAAASVASGRPKRVRKQTKFYGGM